VSLRVLTPDFGMLSSRAMELEAEFRKAHHYLKQHAESVAFFGGAAREGANIRARLAAVLTQHARVARARWAHAVVDDLFTKQLPHNATWALTLLYALQRDDSAWVGSVAQVRSGACTGGTLPHRWNGCDGTKSKAGALRMQMDLCHCRSSSVCPASSSAHSGQCCVQHHAATACSASSALV
jgi:hypothetical protein